MTFIGDMPAADSWEPIHAILYVDIYFPRLGLFDSLDHLFRSPLKVLLWSEIAQPSRDIFEFSLDEAQT